MNRSWRKSFGFLLFLGAVMMLWPTVPAQEAATSPAPSMLAVKSPVDVFRELLAMTPEERRKAIANRSLEDQKLILAKVREYEAMKPEQRELRLRITELHGYLLPLLTSAPADRAGQLALLPAEMRGLVEARLQRWDRLTPEVQRELLANEQGLQLITQLQSSTKEEQDRILADMSPERRQRLEDDVARIRNMLPHQRRELSERFNQFFGLTSREKQKALETLSEPERQQMERTLRAFEKLSDPQRDQYIQSFQKFAEMNLADRQQFLKNAERWRLMSPDERNAWRNLVKNVPEPTDLPPTPPGMNSSAPAPSSAAVATNERKGY